MQKSNLAVILPNKTCPDALLLMAILQCATRCMDSVNTLNTKKSIQKRGIKGGIIPYLGAKNGPTPNKILKKRK